MELTIELAKKESVIIARYENEIENMDSAFNLYPGHLETLRSGVRKNVPIVL